MNNIMNISLVKIWEMACQNEKYVKYTFESNIVTVFAIKIKKSTSHNSEKDSIRLMNRLYLPNGQIILMFGTLHEYISLSEYCRLKELHLKARGLIADAEQMLIDEQFLSKEFGVDIDENLKEQISTQSFNSAINDIAKTISESNNKLTPKHLTDNGWITEQLDDKTFYVEKNIKEKHKVLIRFDHDCYQVWYGEARTFFALESTVEWLLVFLLLRSPHVKFSKPIDILKGEAI